jgi:predicted nucleic-acid-binding protein
MLGIDTNSLVRFLVRDDAEQFEIVHQIVEREVLASRRVFVSRNRSHPLKKSRQRDDLYGIVAKLANDLTDAARCT